MLPTHVQEVLEFLTSNGFSRAASALRKDVIEMGLLDDGPGVQLAPVRISRPTTRSISCSSSSGDFLSMGSSPSDLSNPYGAWSPVRPKSEDSSSRQSEFGTARDYNNPNIFDDSCWYGEQYEDYLMDPFIMPSTTTSNSFHSEDKFVMSIDNGGNVNQESIKIRVTSKPEIYRCSFSLCGCCNEKNVERNKTTNSSSSIYGRYQIMDDDTEILDERDEDECQMKNVDECPKTILWKSNSLYEQNETSDLNNFVMNDSYAVDQHASRNNDIANRHEDNWKEHSAIDTNKDLDIGTYDTQLVPNKCSDTDVNDIYEFGSFEPSSAIKVGSEDNGFANELQLCNTNNEEYEIFELRIIHHKSRTGFEENKEFPIVINSVIAGRYYITELLGSGAFSSVVQAYDLHTGADVSLKIIKNDKDFFDQSLDEIKLLRFVNKHDPCDQCHIVRLHDYFYHQEHLFIVCELLKANLYEFQRYNEESGGDVYFTLPKIQSIARQCLEALEYLHHLEIIHCDLKPENILIKSYSRCEVKVIDLGSSCFQTDTLSFYVQSRSYRAPEVIIGLSYNEKIDIWSLGCILAELYTGDVLFPNESLPMMLFRMIGILGPIDEKMLSEGQETHKYFTKDNKLFHRNEETDQIKFLRPKKSSLGHHLQVNDAAFLEFLHSLLQINPKRRPTASQALNHGWLSIAYS